MSVTVHPRSLCKCGEAGAPLALIDPAGNEINLMVCEACRSATMARLDRVRPVFFAMLAVNVPSAIASETMTYLLELLDAADAR